MAPLETGLDARAAREKMGVTQDNLADTLGISTRQMRRHESEYALDKLIALAIECLLRRRAASHQMAVSPEERAERKFREQQRLRELRDAAGIGPVARIKRQLDDSELRKRLSLLRARNRARNAERPVVARLQGALKRLAAEGAWDDYRKTLDAAQLAYGGTTIYTAEYIDAARQGPPPDDSPLITLPLEIEP